MVLVTGGTGFLGAYIIQDLVEKGYKVRALRREGSKLPFFVPASIFSTVEWVESDVLDVVGLDAAMEGVDTVIHAAAVVSFSPDMKKAMRQVNIEGTANVVNVALEKGVRRFVHISSVAALGRTRSGETVTEKKEWTETSLNSVYAITKYKAEMEVWRGIAEGLEGLILNPSIVLGYGDWNNSSNAIFKAVYNQFPWYTTGVNGFVYVKDVARTTVLLMESTITGERFIINGDNWSYEKVFNTIADAFGKRRPHRKVTPFLALVALITEKVKYLVTGKKSLLTRETARASQSETYYVNEKITTALPGFQFTPLETVIRESAEQYLRHIG
ncbi:MAG: NAD-dependent epimerase/dehydratase family protein [Chitinophagaceae bacterium]|nr:NAD-dependent epimerase/dehydratase family protein [Chitinophagaceae bacterium]